MCFVWISEQPAIISLYNINWLVFITETECVYCAVRTGSLYIIQVKLCIWKVKLDYGGNKDVAPSNVLEYLERLTTEYGTRVSWNWIGLPDIHFHHSSIHRIPWTSEEAGLIVCLGRSPAISVFSFRFRICRCAAGCITDWFMWDEATCTLLGDTERLPTWAGSEILLFLINLLFFFPHFKSKKLWCANFRLHLLN